MKTRIDVNEIKELQARRREINSFDIKDVEWVDGDKTLDISPQIIEDWRHAGLSLCDFVDTEFYLYGWTEWGSGNARVVPSSGGESQGQGR